MSDIPDWLVELAAQRDDEADTAAASEDAPVGADEAAAGDVQSEWDFLRPSPVVTPAEASAAEGLQTEGPADEGLAAEESDDWDAFVRGIAAPAPAEAVAEEASEGEIVEVLRSQVKSDEAVPQEDVAMRAVGAGRGIAGLLPWQQAVLAILLLLDIAVIGLLFLVMLGKMSIG